MKTETHRRVSRQAEPRGHATFLDEKHANVWTEALVSSLQRQPAEPIEWKLKAKTQAQGIPGHIYLRWGAAAGGITASEIGQVIESRLEELMKGKDNASSDDGDEAVVSAELLSAGAKNSDQKRWHGWNDISAAGWSDWNVVDGNIASSWHTSGCLSRDTPPTHAYSEDTDHTGMKQLNEQAPIQCAAEKFSVSLWRFKNIERLREVILASALAARLMSQGIDIEPSWAKGAKVPSTNASISSSGRDHITAASISCSCEAAG
jgi:hypothetical protein